ncbi:hypothetical protein AVEN_47121-1 [Araneus ventricosus]|uniref:Uncharacterized protein n=1 Tax=Araneus ventricosus TaxID=182803 RepID=A0A4Y2R8N2_ARAVE|nr:hypothetical protein AVEN_47121-1 [Araneus ventricosus]
MPTAFKRKIITIPWKRPTPDLYANKSCKHTKYRSGVYRPPYLRYVTPKGWGLGRCILDVAEISFETSVDMLKECCAYRKHE